jgi:hypothetical protein
MDARRWFGSSGMSLMEYLAALELTVGFVDCMDMAYVGVAAEIAPAAVVSFVSPYSHWLARSGCVV